VSTVFFDIDTQLDFLYPSGALYVPGAEDLLGAFARLAQYAAAQGIPVISTTDAHAEDDPEFKQWPPHCVAGTQGQHKPACTLLEKRVVIPTAPGDYAIEGAQQIIIEKQALDCFTNPNLPGIVARLNADQYVVYGVVTEYCVRSAALGLLKTGKPVHLVTDAIKSLSADAEQRTIAEFEGEGGMLTTVEQLVGN